jgi:site-specific DNA recombinase
MSEPLRAVIYTRISKDAEEKGQGVARQEEDCRALCQRNGWTVAEVYVENDISASTKARAARPLYAEMLARARAGEFGAIVAYSNSRLTRRPREFEDLIDLAERRGTVIHTVVSGNDDLATADGRMIARIKASVDVGEAERTSERCARAKMQAAEKGLYRGGPRPYGFEKDGVRMRAAEARVIRESISAVLSGRSLAALAKDLNDRGLPTSTGRPWTYNRLRDVLIRPRHAGKLSKGRADRGEAEIVGDAVWDPIVDEETWRAVYALLIDPARRSPRGNATVWLGAGIYRCGRCGSVMRSTATGNTASRPGGRRHHYRCTASNHLTVAAVKTDEWVRTVVADLVRDPAMVATMVAPDPDLAAHRERRIALTERMADFERGLYEGNLHHSEFRRLTDRLTAELAEVDEKITASVQRSTSVPVLAAADPGAAFLAAPVDVQRAVLRSVLTVEVLPAPERGKPWSSARLRTAPVTS